MARDLYVHAIREQGMHFVVDTGRHSVHLDYPLGPGVTEGPTPLEMLLAALASCAGGTLALLLGRANMPPSGLEVEARGTRSEEHPTVLTHIDLEFVVHGADLEPETIARSLKLAEEQLCPVWATMKPGTVIDHSFRIVQPGSAPNDPRR
jgi:putative redox protein